MKLDLEGRSFLLFGGKGGNGKTTSACATALYLARERPNQKILIVSTDPAHSIGDSFECTVGSSVTPIEGVENLWGLEVASQEELDWFKQQYVGVIRIILDRGTWFDKEDIDGFLELDPPGIDELMAIIRIGKLLREGKFDVIIVDTAPTGHTIRFLAMPDELGKWVSLLELMQSKHRFLMRSWTGRYRKDDADKFLKTMQEDVKRVRRLLRGLRTTLFIPVVIPEDLPVAETEKLLTVLKKHHIPTRYIIVNRMKRSNGNCRYCSPAIEDQRNWMDNIRDKFRQYDLCEVPAFPYDIQGLERLNEYGDYLFVGKGEPSAFLSDGRPSRLDIHVSGRGDGRPPSRELNLEPSDTGLSFVIFGGKGGVGKTSIAAATALHLSGEYPTKKVLIFSTDPAHSLGESFDIPIGESVVQIVPELNLFGIEINAETLLADFNKTFMESITALFNRFTGGGVNLVFDREILEEMASTSPLGLDEMMALAKVMEYVNEERFDIYIFDSAATGHLLKFLSMPDAIRDWLKVNFRLQIKYKEVMGMSELARELLDLAKKVRRVQSILTDGERCQFVAVTIPEIMAIKELDRLLCGINDLNIASSNVVVNMVRANSDCDFCQFKGEREHELIEKLIRNKQPDYQITQVPLFDDQVRGIKTLTQLGEVLYAQSEKEYA